jgi:hypothetical protein
VNRRLRHIFQQMIVNGNDILHVLGCVFCSSKVVKHLEDEELMNFIHRRTLYDADPHLIGDIDDIRVLLDGKEVNL